MRMETIGALVLGLAMCLGLAHAMAEALFWDRRPEVAAAQTSVKAPSDLRTRPATENPTGQTPGKARGESGTSPSAR
jgi:hypothetical protein